MYRINGISTSAKNSIYQLHNIYQRGRCSTSIIVSCTVEFFIPLCKMIRTENNASNHPKHNDMYQTIHNKRHITKQHVSSNSPPVCGVPLPLIELHEDGSNHSNQEECDCHLLIMEKMPIRVVTKRGKPTLSASQPPSKFSSTTS